MFVYFIDKNAKANVLILQLRYLVYALRFLGLRVKVPTIKASRFQASEVQAFKV